MRDTFNWQAGVEVGQAVPPVAQFAEQVMSVMAQRMRGKCAQGRYPVPRAELIQGLAQAALADDAVLAAFREGMREQKITDSLMADVYIPAAACWLGEAWEEDIVTFAEVSIATCRFQRILRELGTVWAADIFAPQAVGAVLVVVPEGEQHTLGALVAMGKLRRMGISVCLRMGLLVSDLPVLMQGRAFDGVLISLSRQEMFPAVKSIVKALRRAGQRDMSIVIGGAIVCNSGPLALDMTGADAAMNNINEALQLFGLSDVAKLPVL